MTLTPTLLKETDTDILARLAETVGTGIDNIRLFSDYSELLTAVLLAKAADTTRLYIVGHAPTDIAIIADRADIDMTESLGSSPFAADIESLAELPVSSNDIIYLSNPNRVTGATIAGADIEMLANAVPDGLLIVDEQYFDFYGISAVELLAEYSNIMILRSFATTFGVHSAESGYAVGSETLFRNVESATNGRISATTRRMISTILNDRTARSNRLAMVHGESLRIAGALNRLGIQNRISATDFVLLRVKDPAAVGNMLARHRVSIDNLDGYPGLDHYLRYRIQSPGTNDELIRSLSRMPESAYRMNDLDRRLATMRKAAERTEKEFRGNPAIVWANSNRRAARK